MVEGSRLGSASIMALYCILNLSVTISNKAVLECAVGPHLLTAIHATSTTLGCAMRLAAVGKQPFSFDWHLRTGLFSVLYMTNILLSNLSLALVSLPVHQTLRATTPIITVVFTLLTSPSVLSSYRRSTYLSLLSITIGAMLAALSSKQATNPGGSSVQWLGVIITLLGACSAVLKTVLTHKFVTQRHTKMSSLHLLQLLSIYAAFESYVMAWWKGELLNPRAMFDDLSRSNMVWLLVLVNALMAMCLNLVSFEANKRCGPISMTVAGSGKQIALLAISCLNSKTLDWKIVFGAVLTAGGSLWYCLVGNIKS